MANFLEKYVSFLNEEGDNVVEEEEQWLNCLAMASSDNQK